MKIQPTPSFARQGGGQISRKGWLAIVFVLLIAIKMLLNHQATVKPRPVAGMPPPILPSQVVERALTSIGSESASSNPEIQWSDDSLRPVEHLPPGAGNEPDSDPAFKESRFAESGTPPEGQAPEGIGSPERPPEKNIQFPNTSTRPRVPFFQTNHFDRLPPYPIALP